ncbi:MAG TPA: hypothetical protein VFG69_12905, partial [Nannocystaceae bacterium]|nr:hypothetical protein [Nannocystaceae bacterium]
MRGLVVSFVGIAVASLAGAPVLAAVAVQRTRFELPSSNGHGAIVVDLDDVRRITQLREHSFSAEEPQLDENGAEIWNGSGFAAVYTRDVLYDAYFGLRGPAGATWLPNVESDRDASGYLGWQDEQPGGTGIVALVQDHGDLHATTYAFAPIDLGHTGFVMILHVRNDGDVPAVGVQAFSMHNFHLGFGRPASPF